MVCLMGLEPMTPCLKGRCSNQLNYRHINESAEHLIGTLSPCETSIVYLLAEFEPLTIADDWWDA